MKKFFYLFFSLLAYLAAVSFELGCRYSERNARHAAPRPPAVRHSGRHTAAYLRAEVAR